MDTERELMKAFEETDAAALDLLTDGIELADKRSVRSGRRAAKRILGKERFTVNNNLRKKTVLTVIGLAAALGLSVTAAAVGYDYYVNHKQSVDNYLGEGAADTLEEQGLIDGEEIVLTEHLRITEETTLSTGNVTSLIVTVEGVDEEGRELLNSQTKTLELDYGSLIEDDDKVCMSSTAPRFGDGYVTYLYDVVYRDHEEPVNAYIGMYLCDIDPDGGFVGQVTDGEYMGDILFTTEPNVEGIPFVGEENGKRFLLYDFSLTSDDYIPIDGEPYAWENVDTEQLERTEDFSWDVTLEYADGSTDTLGGQDFNDMSHTGKEGLTTITDWETQSDSRAVFSRLIDSENVIAVTINGERYVRE